MECPRIPHNDITPVINKAANRRLNAIFKHFTGSNEQAIPPLTGKVALVTGATRGIGRGCALALAKAGCKVYITGRTKVGTSKLPGSIDEATEAINAAAEAAGLGGSCVGMYCDHANDEDTNNVFNQLLRDNHGCLDILVNNACDAGSGINQNGESWWERDTMEHFDNHTRVGLRSHYFCAMLASKAMVERAKAKKRSNNSNDGPLNGLIVNISSFGGMKRYTSVPYGIAKSSTDRFTRDCAEDLKPHRIAMVSMWPGLIKTERLLMGLRGDRISKSKAPESPEFVGRAVVFLSADENGRRTMEKSGKVVMSHELGAEFGFTDVDGNVPNDRVMKALRGEMQSPPSFWQANWKGFVPTGNDVPLVRRERTSSTEEEQTD